MAIKSAANEAPRLSSRGREPSAEDFGLYDAKFRQLVVIFVIEARLPMADEANLGQGSDLRPVDQAKAALCQILGHFPESGEFGIARLAVMIAIVNLLY